MPSCKISKLWGSNAQHRKYKQYYCNNFVRGQMDPEFSMAITSEGI